jgi:hypothetical protein
MKSKDIWTNAYGRFVGKLCEANIDLHNSY